MAYELVVYELVSYDVAASNGLQIATDWRDIEHQTQSSNDISNGFTYSNPSNSD